MKLLHLGFLAAAMVAPCLSTADASNPAASPVAVDPSVTLNSYAKEAIASASAAKYSPPSAGCKLLSLAFTGTNKVHFPGSSQYEAEVGSYWAVQARLRPICVFSPTSTPDVSIAIVILNLSQKQFGIKGGGHSANPGDAGISNGVLFAMTNITTLSLSSDQNAVTIGAGHHWQEVYDFLAQTGHICNGGRTGLPGVFGLTLGGGLSLTGDKHGFAADTVQNFEVVLGNGRIVNANSKENSDLFFGLKGGGNNFGVVTEITMDTISAPQILGGLVRYNSTFTPQFLDALADFAEKGSKDTNAGIIPILIAQPTTTPPSTSILCVLFYSSPTVNPPPVLLPFLQIPSMSNTVHIRTLADLARETSGVFNNVSREEFHIVSTQANRQTAQIVNDAFVPTAMRELAGTSLEVDSVTLQLVTREFIEAGIARGGNPMNLDPEKAPYFLCVQNPTWLNATDDALIKSVTNSIGDTIGRNTAAKGFSIAYEYLNDASSDEPVFSTYRDLARLKLVRDKYDPTRVFKRLVPGGFKIPE